VKKAIKKTAGHKQTGKLEKGAVHNSVFFLPILLSDNFFKKSKIFFYRHNSATIINHIVSTNKSN
jgi:hypothetical protein